MNAMFSLHGEYRFPEKNSSTFQGLFQGYFYSFQGHFQRHSRCVTIKKYRVTRQNLEFVCNSPLSHRSLRMGRWKLPLVGIIFIEMRFIHDNSRWRNIKNIKISGCFIFQGQIVIFKHFSRKNHHFQGKIKNQALFKHSTEIQALFKVCTHPALSIQKFESLKNTDYHNCLFTAPWCVWLTS